VPVGISHAAPLRTDLSDHGRHQDDIVLAIPAKWPRYLCRSTKHGLERRKERKFPILLAFVAQAAVDQLDEVVAPREPGTS
jgi:hypothetical protein